MTNTKMINHKNKENNSKGGGGGGEVIAPSARTSPPVPNPSPSSIISTGSHHQHNKELISITNSISHHVSLHSLNIDKEFDVIKTLAEGCFAKLILVKKGTDKMVLKAIHSEVSSEADFRRELNYNYFLSPHPNIVTSFNVSFLWDNCFVFVQEFAPFGDLSRFVKKGGLPQESVKLIASQLSNALDFMHGLHLVHRDLKLENILVFKTNLSVIKLCDFGYTYAEGSLVAKTNQTWIPFSPPEICQIVLQEKYYCHSSSDVWQVGIILYFCLTGEEPWACADITDTAFCQYTDWLRRRSLRMPESFNSFTPRFIRLLKRLLEPKPSKRYEVREIMKYLNDKWIRNGKHGGGGSTNDQGHLSLLLLDRKESVNTSSRRSSQRQTNKSKSNASNTNTPADEAENPTNSQHHLSASHRGTGGGERQSRSSRHNKSIKHSRSKSCRKSLKIYGIETEIDKNQISERVVNWISNNSNNNNNNDNFLSVGDCIDACTMSRPISSPTITTNHHHHNSLSQKELDFPTNK